MFILFVMVDANIQYICIMHTNWLQNDYTGCPRINVHLYNTGKFAKKFVTSCLALI